MPTTYAFFGYSISMGFVTVNDSLSCIKFFMQVWYGKGCFLGVPVLLASAELDVDGLSGWDLSASSRLQRQA